MSPKKELYLFTALMLLSNFFLLSAKEMLQNNAIFMGLLFLSIGFFGLYIIFSNTKSLIYDGEFFLDRLNVRIKQIQKLEEDIERFKEGVRLYRNLYAHSRTKSNLDESFEKDIRIWEETFGVKNAKLDNNFLPWFITLSKY